MAGINYGRVALGALAGGIVANACDFVINAILFVEDNERMVQRLNLNPAQVEGSMIAWAIIDFLYAFLIVWNYAAVRPRFGPGAGTAIKAGLVIWAAVTAILTGFEQMGIFTPDSFMKFMAASLVTNILVSVVGGYLYKESA